MLNDVKESANTSTGFFTGAEGAMSVAAPSRDAVFSTSTYGALQWMQWRHVCGHSVRLRQVR